MKLREYLNTNGIKQIHFAKQLGITPKHLWLIMCKGQEPGLRLALKIKKLTNGKVKPEDLITELEEENIKNP